MKSRNTKRAANPITKKKNSSAVLEVKHQIQNLSKKDQQELFKSLRADFSQYVKSIGGNIDETSTKTDKTSLTPQQVANALGVSKPYILKLIKQGKILASNFDGRNKIALGDFKKFEKEFTKKVKLVKKHVQRSLDSVGDAYFDDLPESMK